MYPPTPDAPALPAAAQPGANPMAGQAEAPAAREALMHRFRHSLQSGEASPLLRLILRHALETTPCQTKP